MVRNNGYTLIEVLVASAIFAGLATLLATSLFSILKGKTKTELIKEIRQNGAQSMEQIVQEVTGATISEAECSAAASSLVITNAAGQAVTFSCSGGDLTRGGSSLINSQAVAVSSCGFSCSDSGNRKKVTIEFTLSQLGSPTAQEKRAQQSFFQTVLVRNQ